MHRTGIPSLDYKGAVAATVHVFLDPGESISDTSICSTQYMCMPHANKEFELTMRNEAQVSRRELEQTESPKRAT